jgi:hypothetical protein
MPFDQSALATVRRRAPLPWPDAIALVCSNHNPSLFISNPHANQCVPAAMLDIAEGVMQTEIDPSELAWLLDLLVL